ncbi:hypothetical protein [Gilvimarinus sp. 1_MG-2023]|uniref:hypothetical protein n=1 Tax=Gilvimarinus sp. 1_MG-2023 TaxID=3062638 RepID=UPI0026E233F9|nr:hypothetical protein [Gilvimarinus sp. 1_MG-2023]MDO6746802.1 hypothetical protein [Gilvimarinus sp. 1_MG-2023]
MFNLFTNKTRSKHYSPAALVAPHDYSAIDTLVKVIEVSDAEPFIGRLFARKFGSPAPDYPRHFVSFYAPKEAEQPIALGYYHQSPFEQCYLGGGLVIDERAYRRLPAAHRKIIRAAGGIAEHLSIKTFELLGDHVDAIWGHVGNQQAKKVDSRVGGLSVSNSEHLMVLWRNQALSQAQKQQITRKVSDLPPF